MSDKIKTRHSYDLSFTCDNGDAGVVFNATCPECHYEVRVAPHMWWDAVCRCGYKWRLILEAEGEKESTD